MHNVIVVECTTALVSMCPCSVWPLSATAPVFPLSFLFTSITMTKGTGTTQRGKTRGVNWTAAEHLALMEAYGVITFDSITGANQTSEVFASRIEREYLRNRRCPSEVEYHSNYHPSTWYGRDSRSCKLQADAIRSECTAFRQALNRVQVAAVTGNTTPAGLWKCALYVYNGKGSAVPQVLYRIATEAENAEDCGQPFKYENVYRYLDETPSMRRLLDADEGTLGGTRPEGGFGGDANVGDHEDEGKAGDGRSEHGSKSRGRPVGQKQAHRLKRAQAEMDSGDAAVTRLSDTVSDLIQMKRKKAESKGIELERQFNAFEILVKSSQHHFLDDSDKERLGKAMRKQLLSWIETSNPAPDATSPKKPCDDFMPTTQPRASLHTEAAESGSEVGAEDKDVEIMQNVLRRGDAEQ
jgi:hypothetical protein